jgi:putative transposase
LLGLWIAGTEGATFWWHVLNELHSRGMRGCFIACVDGLKGLTEAIEAVFPKTQVQLYIVHKARSSLRYVNWKQRRDDWLLAPLKAQERQLLMEVIEERAERASTLIASQLPVQD